MQTMRKRYRGGAVAGLLLLFVLQLVAVARLYSLNWDEAHHLYDGYRIWTLHDYRLNAEVPPLVKLVAALPLLPMHLHVPLNLADTQGVHAFVEGRKFVVGNGLDRVLLPARMACLGLTVLLAWLLYVWTRQMFGSGAAMAALALFVFDPLVLAHGTLVSTDVGSALFVFATVYAFYRYCKAPSLARLAMVGGLAGLAMCAKFTGMFVLPMLLLLAGVEAVMARSWRVLLRRLGACVGILLCAWVVVWAFYGFRYEAAPAGMELTPQLVPYAASVPGHATATELGIAAKMHLLPEAYLWGLAHTKTTEWEYTSYFFGRIYRHGPWQYFPAAFVIKSTLPLLLLLAMLPFLWFRRGDRRARELCFLLVPVVSYFALVMSSHMAIGVRHLLPIYPFLYVLAGAAVARAMARRRVWAAAGGLLVVWQVGTSLHAAPDYMAYGNEAWGGPAQVHRYLSDANTDWGQQLKSVKRYLDVNHITDCWFAYFPDGAVEPADYGVPCKRLPTGSSLYWFQLPMEVPPVIEGTVLISDSDLEGTESGDGALNWFAPFREATPVATIQQGVYVYRGRFEVPLMSAMVSARDSDAMADADQLDAALALAERAVALAPGSAATQLELADRLAAKLRWSEALEHYERAGELARTVKPELEDETFVPRSEAGVAEAEGHLRLSLRH